MSNTLRILLIALCCVLLPASAWAQAETRIEMKVAARVKSGEPIRVRDVAEVAGDNAEKIGELILVVDPVDETPAGATWIEITADKVKNAASAASIAPGTMTVTGGTCAVRFIGLKNFRELGQSDPPSPPTTAPRDEHTGDTGEGLIKGVVLARLAQMLQVTPSELRVTFDDRDTDLLSRSATGENGNGRVLTVPTAAALSQRIPIRVTLFDGDRLIEERTISTEVLVNTPTLVLLTGVDRGTEITPQVVSERMQWLAPSPKPAATREQTIGTLARTRLEAGRIIGTNDVENPVAAKRGEIVYVDCLSGQLVVKVRARAVDTSREGEIAELKIDGSDGSFFARMSGKGRAVMLVGNQQAASVHTGETPVPR